MIPRRRARLARSYARAPKAHGHPHSLRVRGEGHALAQGRGAWLVRGGRAHDRDRLGHRGVAARGPVFRRGIGL